MKLKQIDHPRNMTLVTVSEPSIKTFSDYRLKMSAVKEKETTHDQTYKGMY